MVLSGRQIDTENSGCSKDGDLPNIEIDSDIRRAKTLPSKIYSSAALEMAKDRVFARSWLFAGKRSEIITSTINPYLMMEGYLDEPLLFVDDPENGITCLSNVCTHRGALLIEKSCDKKIIRCPYHGRTFNPCGKILAAPGFEQALDFPGESDNLPALPVHLWRDFLFTGIWPSFAPEKLFADLDRRLHWLPVESFVLDEKLSRDYLVKANWALYVDNYLEGLHVPYVHPTLARLLDVKSYRTELLDYGNLQIGIASSDEDVFELPADSPDYGSKIAAYYYWLYPNLMLNFYPWGLSVNIVYPKGPEETLVRFLTYVWDRSRMSCYSPDDIDTTQKEDEYVVELVRDGLKSRIYTRGRYAPGWEDGVHQFHRILLEDLSFSSLQDDSGFIGKVHA